MGVTNLDTLQLKTALKSNDGTTVIDAATKAATFAGGVTAAITGNVTGNVTGSVTGNVTGNVSGNVQATPQLISGDGAITVPAGSGAIFLTKGSAAAITIVAPTAGTDDGKELLIVSETAFAHVVTCASDGFNAKGSSGTLTFTAAANNWVRIIARNGHWRVVGTLNVTAA